MEHILLQSNENIKSLINLMMLHEENISRNIPKHDSDILMNANTYVECEYASLTNPVNKWNVITSESFKPNEPMILVKECGHTFKKEYFMNWIKTHNTCMYCPAVLF